MALDCDKCLRLTFILIFCVSFVTGSKLNVPRVLLPVFEDFNLNFTLEATDGACYKWSTTRIDIIQLTPTEVDPDLECSTKVVVTAITKEPIRNIAVVFAEDVYTKQVVRCDVIVDVIDSLQVFSKTRELFMEEAPEIFDARGFDSQGNEFTTLQGIELDWSLVTSGPNKDAIIVRFTTFKDSPYEIPPSIKLIEEQEKRGHMVLLEGVKTGSAKVIVKMPQKEYQHVPAHEIQLMVVANLIIIPSDVYIMAGDIITFKVKHINNGQMEDVPLPHSQYYLGVEDSTVAQANVKNGEVTGLQEGRTKVVLHDRNIGTKDPNVKFPSATLNVVKPAYMALSILPHKNWAILLSDHHELVAEVYSSNDHKLHLGPGVEVHTQVGEAFQVEERSINGSWLHGWAKIEGKAPVQATIESIVHPKLGHFKIKPPLKAANEIYIFPRIVLDPSEVILPWDPVSRPKYDVDIIATGGDGKLLWSSSNHSVGMVSQAGKVRTHSMGYFEVSAAMQRNHHNRANARFHILPPSRLEIVEFVMESEVGSAIYLHIALYAERPGKDGAPSSHLPFTECQQLPFKVKTSDSSFLHNRNDVIPTVGISCANVAIFSKNVGTSKVTISYGKEGAESAFPLEDSVTVSTYKTLELVHPKTCEIVLAVGTTLNLVYTGGPRPPIGQPGAEQSRIITVADNSTVDAFDITDAYPGEQDRTVLRVFCKKLGETQVSLSVSNKPTVPNCVSKESSVVVSVICGKPRALYLQPEIKVANVESCPMELGTDRVVVQSYRDVELNVIVLDPAGRRFLNITSLRFNWTLAPRHMGFLHSEFSTFDRLYDLGGGLMFGNTSYQLMTPNATAGMIEVFSTIIGYNQTVLMKMRVKSEWPEFLDEEENNKVLKPISTTLKMYLVDDPVATPNELIMYNHPANKKIVSVQQGSGYFELSLNSGDIADVKYNEATRQIEIVPIGEGELHITLNDLCLASKPATIIVNVVTVSIIRVEMADKVEIGKCISCVVRLYDESDNLLLLPDLEMVDLKIILEQDLARVQRQDRTDLDDPFNGELNYIITGTELGDTKIMFAIAGADPEVMSAPMDLQVFPPLKLMPRNGTLLIGSSLQFTTKGGPQPDAIIEYIPNVYNIAELDNNGLARGLAVGHTRVSARAVGINPTTGQRLIYSEDTVDLEVIPIKGIKILAPLARFRIGSTVPMWVSGVPDKISPLILGTVEPSFKFNWTIEDPEIGQIKGVFQDLGIKYEDDDQVSIRITGLQKGRTRISVTVLVPAVAANCKSKAFLQYKHSLDIEVFEGLELVKPPTVTGQTILMAPLSTIQLETNLDTTAKLRYSLPSDDSPSNTNVQKVGPNSYGPVVTVTETGLIESTGMIGYAMVLVKAIDEYGLKQTLNLIVEVKPVHYMMINVVSNWRITTAIAKPVTTVPAGTEFMIVNSFHDNTGREFTAGTIPLKLRNSRFDLVRVRPTAENTTFIMSCRRPGHTVVKVWSDGDKRTADYAKLHVEQNIIPNMDHFTAGDIICFYSPLVTPDHQKGVWKSMDPELVHIDATTGIAKVIAPTEGTAIIHHSLHASVPIILKINPAERVIMYAPEYGFITNSPTYTNVVPLVLQDELSLNKTSNLFGVEDCKKQLVKDAIGKPPFSCYIQFTNKTLNIDPLAVFNVDTAFNPETGKYSCNVVSGDRQDIEISTLQATVSIWAVVDNSYISSEPLELPFYPAIFVKSEIELEENSFNGILQIYGLNKILDQVTVTPVDPTLIEVYDGVRPSKSELNHEFSLIDYHWKLEELDEPLSIIVSSQLTNQNIKVRVKVAGNSKFDKDQCAGARHSALTMFFIRYRHTLTIIISMIIIFFVTFYAYSRYIQPVINVNVNPNRSVLSSAQQICAANASLSPECSPYNSSFGHGNLSFRQSSPVERNQSYFCKNEPVYGDPSSFYSTSPDLRRNRRFM